MTIGIDIWTQNEDEMSVLKEDETVKENCRLKDKDKLLEMCGEMESVKTNNMFTDEFNGFTLCRDDTSINIIETEIETCNTSSEGISTDFKSVNSLIASMTSQSTNKELINDQLIILEPNNPVMVRFQNTLKKHLLKQRDSIKQELLTFDGVIKLKQNEKSSLINEIHNVACQVDCQHNLLSKFHKIKLELDNAKEQFETCINQRKQHYTEITTKITVETKEVSVLKKQLDCSHGLLKELAKYEKEQEITFNMCNQKKSQAKQYKKKLLNEQQKQDLLLLSLTQEILRLEDRIKQLDDQAETKYNERELLKQKVMDSTTDLDAFNEDNYKITLLWNDVLISIQQRDKSYQKTKNDYQEAKDKYYTLLIESNNYKRSAQDEFHKNNDLLNFLKKLKREQNNLKNNFEIYLDKFNILKDEYSKLIQITEFQHQNLDQVALDQKSIKSKINILLNLLDKKSNQKLKYEEEILDELKNQLFTNKYCIQMNNRISELKVQNKEHELILVEAENNLSQALLKLEQYRTTSSNLEKDIEENTKYLNDQGLSLSLLDNEMKKLYIDIQSKSNQIDLENKKIETLKKKQDDGHNLTPQMQIDRARCKIDEVGKEIDLLKQSWIQKQNENVELLDQRNKQSNELHKVQKYVLVMDTKSIKLGQEIICLTKENDQYKRTLINIRNTISKLNDNFSQNVGKSNQLLNENEWMQCSYFAELKENEKRCLDYMDNLKLLKNDLNEIKNIYTEKRRESKSWDSKIKLLIEMKKNEDFSDIDAMKNEIHRMQIRESQLKKILEKIMLDLEVCILRREMIYNKVAAKDIRLKGKNETKQKFLKKLDSLRMNIKKMKIEGKKLDQNINDFQKDKIELESKHIHLKDRQIFIQKNINNLIRSIEDIGATKINNIHHLMYKQNQTKFLDEVRKGKYRLLIKTESKMNEEFANEWKKNCDLIYVVEALKNDFPDLDFQITRLLNILKLIDS